MTDLKKVVLAKGRTLSYATSKVVLEFINYYTHGMGAEKLLEFAEFLNNLDHEDFRLVIALLLTALTEQERDSNLSLLAEQLTEFYLDDSEDGSSDLPDELAGVLEADSEAAQAWQDFYKHSKPDPHLEE
jgi:hypothetical protein